MSKKRLSESERYSKSTEEFLRMSMAEINGKLSQHEVEKFENDYRDLIEDAGGTNAATCLSLLKLLIVFR